MLNKKQFKEEKFCIACNISSNVKKLNKYENNYYCDKHHNQIKKHGKLLDNNTRTTNDLNEYIIHNNENFVEIILYNQDTSEAGRAMIDIEDVEKCKPHKWRLTNKSTKRKEIFYVYSGSGAGNQLPLHRFIMDCPKDKVIDHIDSNPLNNRKSNLRVITKGENLLNKSIKEYHKLGFNGVYYSESGSNSTMPYKTEIQIFHKRIYFRNFIDLETCALVRLLAEVACLKEFRSNSNNDRQFENALKFNKIKILNELEYVLEKIKAKIIEFDIEENRKYVIDFLIKNNIIT